MSRGPDWRPVAAPDFSGSLEGIRTSSALFDRALATALSSVQGVDASMSNRVNNEYQNRILGFQDADALKAALAEDPTLGFNSRRVNAESRGMAAGRIGQLLGETLTRGQIASNDLALKANQRGFDQAVAFDEEVAPLLMQAEALSRAGKDAEANAITEALYSSGKLKSIGGDRALAAGRGLFDATVDRLNFQTSEQNFEELKYRFSRQKLGDQQSDEAAKLTMYVGQNFVDTAEAYEWLRNQKNIDPRVYNAVAGAIPSLGLLEPDLGGMGGDLDLSGGATSGDPLKIVNYEARARGFTAVPDSVKTLGDLDAWGTTVLKGTDGTFSSASGPFQITRNTFREFAPTALGKDWKSLPNTIENQDKVAEAIFNASKGSNQSLRSRWVAFEKMSDAELNAIRKGGWEKARDVIARIEGGIDPAMLTGREVAVRNESSAAGRDDARSDLLANPVVQAYYANIENSSVDRTSAARAAIGKGGAFEGADLDGVLQKMSVVLAAAKDKKIPLNPSQAIAVLANSTRDGKWYRGDFNLFGDAVSGKDDLYLDDDLLEENLSVLANGGAQAARVGLADLEASAAEQKAALDRITSLTQRYQQARARGVPATDKRMRAIQAELVLAQEAYRGLNDDSARGRNGEVFRSSGVEPATKLVEEVRPARGASAAPARPSGNRGGGRSGFVPAGSRGSAPERRAPNATTNLIREFPRGTPKPPKKSTKSSVDELLRLSGR